MPVQSPELTAAESLENLVAEATAFALLLWLLCLLLLDTGLGLSAASLSRQVLVAHALLAGEVGRASCELRCSAACLRRFELRSPFPSTAEILRVVVTGSTLLLLLTLSSGLWRSTSSTRLGEIRVETLRSNRGLGSAVHVLSANVGSGSMATLTIPGRRSGHVPALAVVELHPVVLAVLDLTSALESLSEEITKVVVVGGVLEAKVADVGQVLVELLRETITEVLDGSRLLLLANLLVLLLVGSSLETLPRQTTAEEVHEHVAECLEIVTTGLFPTKMGVDAHVSCGTRERLPLSVWNVLLGLGVTVLLSHAEVDDVDNVRVLAVGTTNEEVVRLDITVDEVLLVDGLYTGQHLLGNHDNGLDGESAVAVVEEILQGRTKEVNDKNVVEAFLAKVIDIGNTSCENKWSVRVVVIHQASTARKLQCGQNKQHDRREHSRHPTRIL